MPATLLAATLPGPAVTAALGSGTLQSEIVLAPKGRIAFDIQLISTPGQSNLAQQVTTRFKEHFQAVGITVDSSAPVKLVVRGTTGKTGRAMSKTRDEEEVVWTVSIQRGGDIFWRQTRRSTSGGIVLVDANVSAAEQEQQANQKRTEQMWKNASNYLLNFALPTYVFTPKAGKGLGTSKLTANGVEK